MFSVPDAVWSLPFPLLFVILLSTGVIVTRREHGNMVKQMVFYRDQIEMKDKTISSQAEAMKNYKSAILSTKKVVEVVKEVVDEKRGE